MLSRDQIQQVLRLLQVFFSNVHQFGSRYGWNKAPAVKFHQWQPAVYFRSQRFFACFRKLPYAGGRLALSHRWNHQRRLFFDMNRYYTDTDYTDFSVWGYRYITVSQTSLWPLLYLSFIQWGCLCGDVNQSRSRSREIGGLTPRWEKLKHAALHLGWEPHTWVGKGKLVVTLSRTPSSLFLPSVLVSILFRLNISFESLWLTC